MACQCEVHHVHVQLLSPLVIVPVPHIDSTRMIPRLEALTSSWTWPWSLGMSRCRLGEEDFKSQYHDFILLLQNLTSRTSVGKMYLTYRKSNRGKEDVEGGQSAMYTVCTFDRILVVRLRNDFEGKYFRFPASAGAPYQTICPRPWPIREKSEAKKSYCTLFGLKHNNLGDP